MTCLSVLSVMWIDVDLDFRVHPQVPKMHAAFKQGSGRQVGATLSGFASQEAEGNAARHRQQGTSAVYSLGAQPEEAADGRGTLQPD